MGRTKGSGRRPIESWAVTAGLVLATAAVGPAPGFGQDRRVVADADARAPEGLIHVFDVGELPDGRVVVTDSREPAILVWDPAAGTLERIGREGQGPREYLGAFSLVPTADGGFGVYDARQARLTIVSADGAVTGVESFVRPPTSGLAPPRGGGTDGRGLIALRSVDPDRGLRRASVVYRWNLATGEADSLGVVMTYARGQEGRGITPMPRGDAWTAGPDGSWARIVADDYHVEWTGGARGDVVGRPIPHEPRAPTDADRDAWVRQMLARSPASVSFGGEGGGGVSDAAVRRYRTELDADRYPDRLPLFEPDFVPSSPRGEIWLQRLDLSDDTRTVFDVIDRMGRRTGQREVPGRARVVGFGAEAVYLVRIDDVDLEWLERVPLDAG